MGAVQLNQLDDAEKMYEASGRCVNKYIYIYIYVLSLSLPLSL